MRGTTGYGRFVLVVGTVAALMASPSKAQNPTDWPTRHRDPANTGINAAETRLTADSVAQLRAAWAARVDPSQPYEPVVLGDMVFSSCSDTNDAAHCALAVADGAVRWRAHAASGVAAAGEATVYVTEASHPARFQALDAASGSQRWSTGFDEAHNVYAGPQVVGGRVYLAADDGRLHVFDGADGRRIWEVEGVEYYATPAVVDARVYMPAGGLAVLDAATGETLWTGRTPTGAPLAASPTVADGLVVVGSRHNIMHAYDAGGCGQELCDPLWSAPFTTVWSAVVHDGAVFVVATTELVALDARTGAVRWRSGADTVSRANIAVAGGLVWAVGSRGHLVAYPTDGCGAQECEPVWQARIDEHREQSRAGPVVAGGSVYVTGAGAVYRFSLPDDGPALRPPTAPRNVEVEAYESQAFVEWEAPLDDGGAPIAAYLVTGSDGRSMWVAGGRTRAHFHDVPTGQTLTFTVRAETAAGMGPSSDESDPETTEPALSPPRAVGVSPGDGQLLVTWRPPEEDGWWGIDRYAVMVEEDGGQTRWVDVDGERTWALVDDVGNDRRYRVMVRVVGGSLSADSDPTGWVTPTGGAVLPDPAPGTARVSGPDRIATAVAVSQTRHDSAAGAVLARADDFPDALTGTPLAARVDGPLLLTSRASLPAPVRSELRRLLPAGAPVYLLGGRAALAPEVEDAVTEAGFTAVRVSGANRYETAVAVAERLGRPDAVLLASGTHFPDALAAGAAAAYQRGAVLLTAGDGAHPATVAYLDDHDASRYAVGGPAATAHPDAHPIVGATREDTAAAVAATFFGHSAVAGIARSDDFADALAGAGHAAGLGGPILLTASGELHEATAAVLCAGTAQGWLYGGRHAIHHAVVVAAADRLAGDGCG